METQDSLDRLGLRWVASSHGSEKKVTFRYALKPRMYLDITPGKLNVRIKYPVGQTGNYQEFIMQAPLVQSPGDAVMWAPLCYAMPPACSTQAALPLAEFKHNLPQCKNDTDNLPLWTTYVKAQLCAVSGPVYPNSVWSLCEKG